MLTAWDKAFLPGQQRVIDLYRPRSNQNCALHALRRHTHVVITAPTVERLCRFVRDGNGHPDPIESAGAGFFLGRCVECGGNPESAMHRSNRDVLQLWGIRQCEVGMPNWFGSLPSHEIEAIALIKPGESQHGSYAFDVSSCERPDLKDHCLRPWPVEQSTHRPVRGLQASSRALHPAARRSKWEGRAPRARRGAGTRVCASPVAPGRGACAGWKRRPATPPPPSSARARPRGRRSACRWRRPRSIQ